MEMSEKICDEHIRMLFDLHQSEFNRKLEIDNSLNVPFIIGAGLFTALFYIFDKYYSVGSNDFTSLFLNGFDYVFFIFFCLSVILDIIGLAIVFTAYLPIQGKNSDTYVSLPSIFEIQKKYVEFNKNQNYSATQKKNRFDWFLVKLLRNLIDWNSETNKNRFYRIWLGKKFLMFSCLFSILTFFSYIVGLIIK